MVLNKYINNYACSGEIDGQTGERTGIGTIAHEFSHVIGLPDLYDIDYGQNYKDYMTPDTWHIMDAGSYNNNGNTPPNYTIYDKYFLGWKTPVNPGNEPQLLTLQPAGTKEYNAYQITTGNTLLPYTSTTTAYYIENRQQEGWDEHLPGHGMMLTKVQYNYNRWFQNIVNNSSSKMGVDLIEAKSNSDNQGKATDLFPAGARLYVGIEDHAIESIEEVDGVIKFKYKGGIEDPGTAVDNTDLSHEIMAVYNILGQKQTTTSITELTTGTYIVVTPTGNHKIVR